MDVAGDLLSELPECIIESILIRMPILDAVRTCVLSSKWRYKWSKIPRLVYDRTLIRILKFNQSCKCMIEWNYTAKFITHTLFLHEGPIHRFEVLVPINPSCPDIDQWILYLSRNTEVKELILAMSSGNCWRVPSCLFKCEKLTYLELRYCILRPPSDFQGFSFLKTLTLKRIDGPPEPIEFLISHCPLLETLSMSCIQRFKLHIDVPRLTCLTLEGQLDDIILVNIPRLLSADITMFSLFDEDAAEHHDLKNQSIFDKFFGAVPLLEKLVGDIFFAKYLSIGNEFAPFPITCNNLAVVELHYISFEDIEEMNVVVRLLVSSPILHTLTISVCQQVKPKSEADVSLPNSNLEHLQQVKLIGMRGHLNEFIFVEILLRQSPVLKTLEISTSPSLRSAQRSKVHVELLGFQRASPLAKIIVLQE